MSLQDSIEITFMIQKISQTMIDPERESQRCKTQGEETLRQGVLLCNEACPLETQRVHLNATGYVPKTHSRLFPLPLAEGVITLRREATFLTMHQQLIK